MELNEWLNSELPEIALTLEQINRDHFFNQRTIGFAGKEGVYKVLQNLRSSLFPGVYEKFPIDEDRVNILIGNNIRTAAVGLSDFVEKVLINKCELVHDENKDCNKCRERADDITVKLIKKLPEIRRLLHTDITAAYNGDPAAKTMEEILLSYPAIDAISIHRIAHELYALEVPIIPRIMSEFSHQMTGIDIHPGAHIGDHFFIDHGTGVVIGETCTIGRNVKIYQGVTLGAKSFPLDANGNPIKGIKRHPDIQDNVVIYSGATILGGDTVIGHDSVIGGNVWLTNSVPPFSKVYNSQPSPTVRDGRQE
jgi:serine O-acetyltransferase